ncbi:MAG TPA: hypothetical protein VHF05_02705 [Candidatus Paceibacterota bacterium]|nr:hypothetical protein [Candidatus Paceibacterota bacterium]
MSFLTALQKQKFLSLTLLVGVLMTGYMFLRHIDPNIHAPSLSRNTAAAEASLPATTTPPNAFKNVQIAAKAAIVLDARSGEVLYEKNADTALPLASLTKIMSAITAADLASMNSTVTVDQFALETDGDNGLYAQESWKLKNLLDFSLIVSSNDGITAIASSLGGTILGETASAAAADPASAEAAFVGRMNNEAEKLDLPTLRFINPTGLDEGVKTGGMGSARDVAKLLSYGISDYPSVFEATRYQSIDVTSENGITHTAVNTDAVLNSIPGLIASKTGYTDLAGGNLAVAFDAGLNRPVVVVVLGSSYDGRFGDMATLVGATEDYIAGSTDKESLASNKE